MGIHRHSRSSLFLIEIIIAILFFSIGAAICVQVFATSYLCTKDSETLSHAQLLVSSMAEVLTGSEGEDSLILHHFPDAVMENNKIRVFYDDNWESCPEESASYLLLVEKEKEKNDLSGTISLLKNDDEKTNVYSLPFFYHIAYQKGGAL
jgi:hypothetical protein